MTRNLLVMDRYGAALDVIVRAKEHGWNVAWYVKETPKNAALGTNIQKRLPSLEAAMRLFPTHLVFLADNTMWMKECDKAPHRIGPTLLSAALELDRSEGQAFLQRYGVRTLKGEEFTHYDDAIRYVTKNPKRYVSKPNGDGDKALSYVAKSAADMVFMLERWKKNKKDIGTFILQPFVEGVEMAIGGFLTPKGFRGPWHENWEFKKLMVGDKGVNTGEMGTVWRTTHTSKLADEILSPLERGLMELRHTGYVDVNCIIDGSGRAWPLEFTTRPGWPSVNIQLGILGAKDPVKAWETGHFPEKLCLGVIVAIPDFPYSTYTGKEVEGIPLYGIDPWDPSHHLLECQLTEGVPTLHNKNIVRRPQFTSAGDYLYVATGCGRTVMEAKKRAYTALERVDVPNNPMYRTDIGDRLRGQLGRIQRFGYATGVRFE